MSLSKGLVGDFDVFGDWHQVKEAPSTSLVSYSFHSLFLQLAPLGMDPI